MKLSDLEKKVLAMEEVVSHYNKILLNLKGLTKEQTDQIFNTITSNGCREMEENRFHQAVNEAIQGQIKVKSERPRIEDFYPKGTDVKTIQNAFIENIEMYNYINALDLYIDEIESKQV